jgi:RNA-directed DNA polymerase
MESVLEKENMIQAHTRVKQNGGSAGVDGMSVERLFDHLRKHWPKIRQTLLDGNYQPKPVKRVMIPKPGGGERPLGIPTVQDRLIQQALMQVLQKDWDDSFSEHSYGFRPNKSAHQAVATAQKYLQQEDRTWVVDMDLEKFFDRVNHDKLMSLISKRVDDKRVLQLIDRFLKAGVDIDGSIQPTTEGTPQGGPLSPLLANLLLDQMDKELERRGHKFVRYADDCNIYVRSAKAGQRVLASITTYVMRTLKLKVNETKSAVDRPWKRKFLGFTFTGRRPNRRTIAKASIDRFKDEVRRITNRTRGVTLQKVINELRVYMVGWKAYFRFSETQRAFKELQKWIKRKLRCYIWKQWSRRRFHKLVARGVSRDLAWNTVKSAHGPWRLSRSPAMAFAFTHGYFKSLGLPDLFDYATQL